jgi:hypothetical protein
MICASGISTQPGGLAPGNGGRWLVINLFYDSSANFLLGWCSWSPSFLALFVGIGLETAHEVAVQFGYGAVQIMMRLCRLGHIVLLRHHELFYEFGFFVFFSSGLGDAASVRMAS